ncbi:MAG: transcriptional regulator [Maritimibacter sp.]|nr:transcriptional regulator [Maritimibacter sp.]
MTQIVHHVPERLLVAYAAGTLPQAFSLVVAAHVSMCDQCRAALEAHHAVGGALLEDEPKSDVSGQLKADLMSRLDDAVPDEPVYRRQGPFPAPVVAAMQGRGPRWTKLGGGVKQSILSADATGSVRLLSIPGGQAVPDHTHGGLELTLVLQGAFADETGRFGAGDLEVANDDLEHKPIAEAGPDCICLAATDAPLRFRALVPRLLQPLFRI